MEISYDLYRVFCTVARAGSISAAASELFVSQSAVSQSIKQLETALGGKLFNRCARGVTLTAEGAAVYEYAKNAADMLDNAQTAFRQMTKMQQGEVRIGASDTICSLFLLERLREYHEKYPDITIKLASGTSDELVDMLKQNRIDMAFANLPINRAEGLKIREVMQISDCFVAGGKFALLAHRTVSIPELQNYPLLMLDKNSSARRIIDKFMLEKGVELQPYIELGSVDLLIECAKIGLGISLVIEQAAQNALRSGELYKLQLSEPMPKRSIGLVTAEGALSVAAQHLVDMM